MEYTPKILSWNVTKRCNLKCAHCYLSAGEAGQGELTTEEALEAVGSRTHHRPAQPPGRPGPGGQPAG